MTSKIAGSLAILAVVLGVSSPFAQTSGTPAPANQVTPQSVVKYWCEPAPPASAGVLERGKWLYRQKGCFLCHNKEGQGGVPNRNYAKDNVPRLGVAKEMKLFEPEDLNAIIDLMKRGVGLDTLADSPPVPQYNVALAQYHSIQDVIRKGNPAGKKNERKPAPALNMPGWRRELSDPDINALIAYILSVVPAEEEPEETPKTP